MSKTQLVNVNNLTQNLNVLTFDEFKKNQQTKKSQRRKHHGGTKIKLEPIWEVFEPEESEREPENDETKDNSLQLVQNESDSEDEVIQVTAKCRDDLSLEYNHAADILLEADRRGYPQHQALASLQILKQRVTSSPRPVIMETFCRQEEDFGVTFTALEYAAYKNKREVVAFLVDVITKDCFSSVLEAGQYFDSLQLLHGMVMGAHRLTSTLDLLLSIIVSYNGRDWLLFSPWAKNEEGKDMMDLLRQNTSMDEGSRRCLETELKGRLDALLGAQLTSICHYCQVGVPQYTDIPLLPELGIIPQVAHLQTGEEDYLQNNAGEDGNSGDGLQNNGEEYVKSGDELQNNGGEYVNSGDGLQNNGEEVGATSGDDGVQWSPSLG